MEAISNIKKYITPDLKMWVSIKGTSRLFLTKVYDVYAESFTIYPPTDNGEKLIVTKKTNLEFMFMMDSGKYYFTTNAIGIVKDKVTLLAINLPKEIVRNEMRAFYRVDILHHLPVFVRQDIDDKPNDRYIKKGEMVTMVCTDISGGGVKLLSPVLLHVDDKLDIDLLISNKRAYSVRIVWCARFIKCKHPELVIKLAKKLKQNNYNVKIDMYGSGEMLDDIKQLATSLDVMDVVSFMGNRANEDILRLFRNYHIFIFTSDRNEGWGAVLNEAMSNGCAVVASDEIGSVPYLIEDYKNGLLFKSKSLDSLYQKVETMISDSTLREAISRNAYETMHNLWSPKIAAENLLNLITYINNGSKGKYNIMQGPCSYDY